ncbi:Trm112 family protein [Gammaproteobacteria bacterium]|nr:Trm112 family protein [Gammaproteobacteria bacterium]
MYNQKMSTFDTKILEVLVCPKTKKPLTYNKETQELINEDNSLAYPVKDDIPVMLIEEARTIS